jgi:hypothetical protein
MASMTKTAGIDLIPHTAGTHPFTVKGSVQSVPTELTATIFLYHALVEASQANTNPGTFYIQGSGEDSNNDNWVDLVKFTVGTAAATTEALTATEPVAETNMAVASTTGFVSGDDIYIQDTTTLAASEFLKVQAIVTDITIELLDGLRVEKDSADIIWAAELFKVQLDITSITRIRAVFIHEGTTGANAHVKAFMITADTIT